MPALLFVCVFFFVFFLGGGCAHLQWQFVLSLTFDSSFVSLFTCYKCKRNLKLLGRDILQLQVGTVLKTLFFMSGSKFAAFLKEQNDALNVTRTLPLGSAHCSLMKW
uniref:Putative secreted protein n=1 Tax=Ixodes ricinus TaxID=34613 RepID=A0A6B0UGK0_IXORI